MERPGVDIYCNPDTGCYIPDECPQDFTVFTEGPMCSCNRELILTNSSYCFNDETVPLPTQECPQPPELSPEDMCLCNDTFICQSELMCEENGCVERPEPCPDLPELAGPQGCYCKEATAICELGQACGGPDNTCYDPTKCLHPMFIQDWDKFLAANMTSVDLDDENYVLEGTQLSMRCLEGAFREDIMDFNDTCIDIFSVQCSSDASWLGLHKCAYPLCGELKFDAANVVETIWGSKEGSQIVQGSIVKLECLDKANTFENIQSISRTFLQCDKKKWNVTDKTLCPNNDNSCEEPVRISCLSNGCSSLPESFQDQVVYDPLLTSYKKGSSLTISCSNQVEPKSKLKAYSNDAQFLMIKKMTMEKKQQDDPEFCLHDDCLPAAGTAWSGKDGNTGKDCVKTDDDTAFCIQPSRLELIGTSIYLKDLYTLYFMDENPRILPAVKDGACFQDKHPRILPNLVPVPNITPELCKQACFVENDYEFAGVQNGNQCWCGSDEPPISNLLDDSQCNKPCQGDPSVMCGAGMKNNVFKKCCSQSSPQELNSACFCQNPSGCNDVKVLSQDHYSQQFKVELALHYANKEEFGKNYYLTPDQGGEFLLDLGCEDSFNTVELVNTHNAHHKDRSTKEFQVYLR